jgi:membrane-anchored mycosin MYCP
MTCGNASRAALYDERRTHTASSAWLRDITDVYSRRMGRRGSTTLTWLVRVTIGIVAATTLVLAPVGPASAQVRECGPSITTPLPDQPWPLRRLRPDVVWPLTRGAGIVVAVIDSGVSDIHPALAGQVLSGHDLVNPSDVGHCDNVGHGTIIAGIIAGRALPSSGFHGIAPDAKILPIRVLATAERSFDEADPSRIASAIRLATDSGAKVINLSLTTVPVPELESAVAYAVARDVVLVAAAGNDGGTQSGEPSYPAAYDGVIAVAGVDEAGNHVSTSTTGDYVDVAAPGAQIAGPAPQGGGYAFLPEGGTSFATAYVSGVAALVRAYRPELKAADVANRIIRTADRPADGWDRNVGAGVVNPYWAVVSVPDDEDEPAPPGQVALPLLKPDPLATVRVAAGWATLIAVVVFALVLGGVSVWRRGKRRGWRPGRPA